MLNERYTRDGARDGVRLLFPEGEGRTKNEFLEETDVNYILRNFQKKGAMAHFAKFGGEYGFAPGLDFQLAMETTIKAQTMFDELPSKVRRRFSFDPALFLDFVQDPENLDAMRELGLTDMPAEAPGRGKPAGAGSPTPEQARAEPAAVAPSGAPAAPAASEAAPAAPAPGAPAQ